MNRRLGVNIDHIATLRQARLGKVPDLGRALPILKKAGADGVTAHLRGDRRHIQDDDIKMLIAESPLPLNLELSPDMVAAALEFKPTAVCLVPEGRRELTTEGGLDVIGLKAELGEAVASLKAVGCRVSLFVAPEAGQIEAAIALKPDAVELHTGDWCNRRQAAQETTQETAATQENTAAAELFTALGECAALLARGGVACHAGHGLDYRTTAAISAIKQIEEFNIGHFLVSEAVFVGLAAAVARMRGVIDDCGG